jgi:LysM repeat protein
MGQLEKYGLYVLCLVIFLILGVSIWGKPDTPSTQRPTAAPISAGGPAGGAAPVVAVERSQSILDLLGSAAGAGTNGNGPGTGPGSGGSAQGGAGTAVTPTPTPTTGATPAPIGDTAKVAYKVLDGDTLDGIAKAKLGGARFVAEIQKLNPGLDPKRLRPGKEIWLPSAAAIAALDRARQPASSGNATTPIANVTPAPSTDRTYVVKKGDNYERIALAMLGSRKRATELMELNPETPATKLQANQRIKLPKN